MLALTIRLPLESHMAGSREKGGEGASKLYKNFHYLLLLLAKRKLLAICVVLGKEQTADKKQDTKKHATWMEEANMIKLNAGAPKQKAPPAPLARLRRNLKDFFVCVERKKVDEADQRRWMMKMLWGWELGKAVGDWVKSLCFISWKRHFVEMCSRVHQKNASQKAWWPWGKWWYFLWMILSGKHFQRGLFFLVRFHLQTGVSNMLNLTIYSTNPFSCLRVVKKIWKKVFLYIINKLCGHV